MLSVLVCLHVIDNLIVALLCHLMFNKNVFFFSKHAMFHRSPGGFLSVSVGGMFLIM